MHIQYLEIVTPEVDSVCQALSAVHSVQFGEPEPNLGGARTAQLESGGLIGVRAPMHESEAPVVRPYTLVEDIESSVESAVSAGAELALPPTELPGHGKCAILMQGGVQTGLWQV